MYVTGPVEYVAAAAAGPPGPAGGGGGCTPSRSCTACLEWSCPRGTGPPWTRSTRWTPSPRSTGHPWLGRCPACSWCCSVRTCGRRAGGGGARGGGGGKDEGAEGLTALGACGRWRLAPRRLPTAGGRGRRAAPARAHAAVVGTEAWRAGDNRGGGDGRDLPGHAEGVACGGIACACVCVPGRAGGGGGWQAGTRHRGGRAGPAGSSCCNITQSCRSALPPEAVWRAALRGRRVRRRC